MMTQQSGGLEPTKYNGRAKDARPSNGIASRWRRVIMVGALGVLLQHLQCIAQCNGQWYQTISVIPGGNLNANRPSIIEDALGNVIVSNGIYGAQNLIIGNDTLPIPNSVGGNNDVFVTKLNALGNHQWTKIMRGVGYNSSLTSATDSEGGIYIGGIMTTSLDIDGTVYARPPNSGSGYFILKLSSEGILQWFKQGDTGRCYAVSWVEGEGLVCAIPFAVSVDIGGVSYIADNSDGSEDVLLVTISADGEEVTFLNNIGGAGSVVVFNMACDGSGCVVQGRFDGNLAFDGLQLNSPGTNHYNFYQVGFDLNGDALWANKSENEESAGLTIMGLSLSGENVYFQGSYYNTSFTYGGVTLPEGFSGSNSQSTVIGKLTRSNGELSWLNETQEQAGTGGPGPVCFTDDAVYISGFMLDSIFEFEGYQIPHGSTSYVLKLDKEGLPICGIGLGGHMRAIIKGEHETFTALLGLPGTMELFGDTITSHGGNLDLIVVKTCLPCDTLTSIAENLIPAASLSIYPNPASQSVSLKLSGNGQRVNAVEVVDMLGHIAMHHKPQTTNLELNINISNLANGIYTIAATMRSGETLRQRLVVQH